MVHLQWKQLKKSKDSSFQRLVKLIESSKPENAKLLKQQINGQLGLW